MRNKIIKAMSQSCKHNVLNKGTNRLSYMKKVFHAMEDFFSYLGTQRIYMLYHLVNYKLGNRKFKRVTMQNKETKNYELHIIYF